MGRLVCQALRLLAAEDLRSDPLTEEGTPGTGDEAGQAEAVDIAPQGVAEERLHETGRGTAATAPVVPGRTGDRRGDFFRALAGRQECHGLATFRRGGGPAEEAPVEIVDLPQPVTPALQDLRDDLSTRLATIQSAGQDEQ